MSPQHPRPARTVLAKLIRERNMTLEEFTTYAEQFAHEHGETGTLSHRHLQRLAAGPTGIVRPATARLLERIFGRPIGTLLSLTDNRCDPSNGSSELQQRLAAARRIDKATIDLLTEQLQTTRRIDRQLGAVVAHAEVAAKVKQVTDLFRYSTSPDSRASLATILCELHTLAG